MDNAVALVRAYLNVNGYFTVTEYPVIEALHEGGYRTLTDLDVLALRLPGAGRVVPVQGADGVQTGIRFGVDPELVCPSDEADLIIGEVKEGRAQLNANMLTPEVLHVTLSRFGCCSGADDVAAAIESLLEQGFAITASGRRVRMMVFAAEREWKQRVPYTVITLGHVVAYLEDYLDEYWDILHNAQFKDAAFGFLMTMKKARGESANN